MRTPCLTGLVLLALGAAAAEPEALPNFLAPFHPDPDEKRLTDDIRLFHGRLYIAYGYTNTKQAHHLIWYDPASGSIDCHRDAAGEPVTWPIEKTYKLRIFDDELFVVDYDPIHGKSNLIRVAADHSVRTQKVSNDAHNRDVVRIGDTLFVSHGRNDIPWPKMRRSTDDGASWHQVDQGDVAEASLHENYFWWNGDCYATSHSTRFPDGFDARGKSFEAVMAALVPTDDVPWLIRYTGDAEAPWESLAMSPGEVLPEHPDRSDKRGNQYIQFAQAAGEELVVVASGHAYALRSLAAADNRALPLGPDHSVIDLERDPAGRVWALVYGPYDREAETGRVLLLRYDDGDWAGVWRQDTRNRPRCIALDGIHCYLGYHRGGLARLALPPE